MWFALGAFGRDAETQGRVELGAVEWIRIACDGWKSKEHTPGGFIPSLQQPLLCCCLLTHTHKHNDLSTVAAAVSHPYTEVPGGGGGDGHGRRLRVPPPPPPPPGASFIQNPAAGKRHEGGRCREGDRLPPELLLQRPRGEGTKNDEGAQVVRTVRRTSSPSWGLFRD